MYETTSTIRFPDTTALYLGGNPANEKFLVLITQSCLVDAPPQKELLLGKKICVSGRIILYKGRPCMQICRSDQIIINDLHSLQHLFYQHVYTANGNEVIFPANTTQLQVASFFDSANFVTAFPVYIASDPRQPGIYRDDYFGQVFFKLFTTTPLYVFTSHPERIKKYISMYNLERYYFSIAFKWDLEKRIAKKDLTVAYVLKTIGQPNKQEKKLSDGNTIEVLYYNHYHIRLFFSNGILTGFKLDI